MGRLAACGLLSAFSALNVAFYVNYGHWYSASAAVFCGLMALTTPR